MKSTGNFTHTLRKLTHYSYDYCSECHSQLPKGEPAYAGYTTERREIYVGACCLSKVDELASHIYWWWTSYERPTSETVLWRYIDFPRFVAMLKSRALYFARADCLGDPFEGARGQTDRFPQWKQHCLQYFKEAIRTAPGGGLPQPEIVDREAERLFGEFQAVGEQEIRRTYVSCWHASDGESEALWRLYAPPPTAGVALCTTFRRLDDAIGAELDVIFGHVQYVNFAKSFAGTYDRIFWKRASLRHESEVRGVIAKPLYQKEPGVGLEVPLNLDQAIQFVVCSPFAPNWFRDVLQETMARFGANLPIRDSSLTAEPFF